jgi:eukaryotic-like serine/threonine-protein kinase
MRFLSRVLTILLAAVSAAVAQDAPMFRGDLQHSGIYNAVGVSKFERVKWRFQTQGRVVSSPAVANGTIYVGSTDQNLYALDLDSGNKKWSFATDGPVVSSPAVSDGVVYFGSYDGKFYAVDTANGQLKWKFQTGGERRYSGKHLHGLQPAEETMPDPWDFYLSSPAVWNATVYFGSGDGNVYALDAAKGQLKWKFQTGDVVHSSPAIANGTLYVGSWDTYLYALDSATGKEKWRFKTGDDPVIHNHVGIQSSPVIADRVVYFGCRDSNVYAVDGNTGKQKWLFSTKGSWVNNSPVAYQGKVYFGQSLPGYFHAVDAQTGAVAFSLDTKVPVFSSAAIASGVLYFGTFDGKLTALDLESRKPVWVFQTEASKQNYPAMSNTDGTINFGAIISQGFYDDMVIGVRKLLSAGAILSSPVVVKNAVYVGSTDGFLYSLE